MNRGKEYINRFGKGISASLIVMIMVLSIAVPLITPVAAAEPWEGYLVLQDTTGDYGTDILVELWVDVTTDQAWAFQTDLHFDTSCVNITNVDATESPFVNCLWSWQYNSGDTYVRIVQDMGNSGTLQPGTYKVATYTLHGESQTPCTSDLLWDNHLVSDTNGDPISNNYTDGTYTCTGGPQPITIDLRADGINGNIINAPSYTVDPGTVTEDGVTINNQTAMGAVVAYCQDNGINVDITMGGYGEWLVQIGDDPADEYNWMYAVNEVQPPVGGAQYDLSDGDYLVWSNSQLNYYTVLTELDSTYVKLNEEDVTATVSWTTPTGTTYLDGAEVFVTDTSYTTGTSVGTTNASGMLTFTPTQTGRWYVYAVDPVHGSGIYNYPAPYYDCWGDVPVTVNATDDCVDGAFTVNIEVDPNGLQVYGVQYDLTFDPSVIQITNMNAGPFLEESGADTQVYVNEYDNVAGTASFAQTRKDTTTGATTPGVLTTISFVTVGNAQDTSDIVLSGVVVSDENAEEIQTVLTDDSIQICDANVPPTASARSNHIYNNVGTVYFCEAELDGTQSTDSDGSIVQYSWAFGDGQYGTGAVVMHKYGSYVFSAPNYTPFTATLTVTDDGGASDDDSCDVIVYIAGDANGDGTVNVLDASMVGLRWHQNGNPTGVAWSGNEMADRADLNNDRTVDILDAVIIGACWGSNA